MKKVLFTSVASLCVISVVQEAGASENSFATPNGGTGSAQTSLAAGTRDRSPDEPGPTGRSSTASGPPPGDWGSLSSTCCTQILYPHGEAVFAPPLSQSCDAPPPPLSSAHAWHAYLTAASVAASPTRQEQQGAKKLLLNNVDR